MTEEKEKFDQEAVQTLANAIKEANDKDEEKAGQSQLLESIAEVAKFYNIPPSERVDFAIEGLDLVIEREKQKIVSDFRETLERLEDIWRRKE